MSKARRECSSNGTRTAANVEESVELAASGCVAVYDGLIHAGVIVEPGLGVSFALLMIVGAECLFRREGSRIVGRLGHGEQLFSRFLGCRMWRLSRGLVGIEAC